MGPGFGVPPTDMKDPLAGLLGDGGGKDPLAGLLGDAGGGELPAGMKEIFESLANMGGP